MANMQWSDAISLAAFLLAALALVLGERRARQNQRATIERNVVHWKVTWPEREAFVLTNEGPDPAHNIYIEITTEHRRCSAEAKRLKAGEPLRVEVPHLGQLWDSTRWIDSNKKGDIAIVSVVGYGGLISWDTPRGVHREEALNSYIQNARAALDPTQPF